MIPALYFDGASARAHRVELAVMNGLLAIVGEDAMRTIPMRKLQLSEPFAAAPCVLELGDGTHCEVAGADARAGLLAMLAYRPSRIERMQARWYGALAGLLGLIGCIALAYFLGIPALTTWLAARIPDSAEIRIGDKAQEALEQKLAQPSRYSDAWASRIEAVARKVVPAHTRMPVRVVERAMPTMGPNALALPNGTIMLTDDMADLIMRHGFNPEAHEEEFAAVIAHEVGHVQLRHAMRGMTQSSLTLAGSWALFGDFSAVASGLPALVSGMAYSREMESEADAYAVQLLRAQGYSPDALARVFALIEAHERERHRGEEKLPAWMRTGVSYIASHPSTPERIARIRALAAQAEGDSAK